MKTLLKISLRSLWYNRFYTLINFVGLAIAIICMLLAVLYWKDEHSFDSFHSNNPNIYRVLTHTVTRDGKVETLGGTGQVQGPAFKAGVPEVVDYTRVMGGDIYSDVTGGNNTLHLQPLFVDRSFFNVFTFPLLSGVAQTMLNEPGNVVLTESTAKKFFNSLDVVGKTLTVDSDPSFQKLGKPLIISGVIKDPPANSSLQFDLLLPFDYLRLSFIDNNWLNSYLGTFVVLHPDADKHTVLQKFNSIYQTNGVAQIGNREFDYYGYDPKITYGLQSFKDIHLSVLSTGSGSEEGGIVNMSNPIYAKVFLTIAFFILLMAAVNFININVAASMKRAKEVGIRKIAGSSKLQIVWLFLFDALIICFLAMLVSIVLLKSILPFFNDLTGKQIVFSEMFDGNLIIYFIVVLIAVTLLAGVYPSWLLSNFKPREVLYSKQKLSGNNLLGKSLVVFQFSLATFLLVSAIVYYSQMRFIQTKDLGYNPNHIIRTQFGGNRDYKAMRNQLYNELSQVPGIQSVSFGNDGWQENIKANSASFKATYKNIDGHFLSTLSIPLKEGRNLSADYGTDDKEGIIVNEAFVRSAGMDDPVGKKIIVALSDDNVEKTIRGVVKDFHFGSLRDRISPMVMYMKDEPEGGMWIRFETSRQKETMAAIEQIYKELLPGAAYRYSFLDELNAKQYFQELRWKKVVTIATVLSFIVCCIGLFGLAHLSTTYRTKEIGVRKVLGATVSQIITTLSFDFLKLVLIAFLIATPLAWFVMNQWLKDFAYRINISIWILVLAGGIAVFTALLTVILQSVKAAIANPVKSLRNE